MIFPIAFPYVAVQGLPSVVINPALSGDPVVGNVLSVSNGTYEDPQPSSFTYLWEADEEVISGATSSTFLLPVTSDLKSVRAKVTATNSAGSIETYSNAFDVIISAPEANGSMPAWDEQQNTGTQTYEADVGFLVTGDPDGDSLTYSLPAKIISVSLVEVAPEEPTDDAFTYGFTIGFKSPVYDPDGASFTEGFSLGFKSEPV